MHEVAEDPTLLLEAELNLKALMEVDLDHEELHQQAKGLVL